MHESGPLSIWLSRELDRRGVPVVCIDARAAHKALSARMNKSDRSDADAIAQLARTGWYREVHIKSENSDRLCLLLSARGNLKTLRTRLGIVRKGRSRRDFQDQLSETVSGDPILEVVFASLIKVYETVCHKTTDLDAEIQKYAKDCPLAKHLTSVPGVGQCGLCNAKGSKKCNGRDCAKNGGHPNAALVRWNRVRQDNGGFARMI